MITPRYVPAICLLLLTAPVLAADRGEHRPVFSPDGKRLVFMSMSPATDGDWELYAMDSDGRNLKRLTHHDGWDGYAVWSPDGSAIVFDRAEGERKTPHIIDLATGEQEALGQFEGWLSVNDWSADGKTLLAFQEIDDRRDLWLLGRDGQLLRRLTDTPDVNEHDAHFSPAGSRIAYAIAMRDEPGAGIRLMDLESGATRTVHRSSGSVYGLAWSPDGTHIAFTDSTPGGEEDDADIYLLDVRDGAVARLTDDDAWDHMPVWHPNGRSLLFTSYRSGSERIYSLDPVSGAVARLWTGSE